ncbi:hypothetical protein L3Q82_011103 [Scortum barcoo]|uniref:Uncharacterized protein n=1 Tax=Scortum barcoo TaxID=214431 RepID=A0ACB8W981_9TELE|nr:hypothetical protein L3Q82_011103 [Scortum barcoo]
MCKILTDWGFVLDLRGDIFVKGKEQVQLGLPLIGRQGERASVRGRSAPTLSAPCAARGPTPGQMAALGRRTGGRMTLAGVVFGLVQARHKERTRETNGGFSLTPCTMQC